MFFYVINSLSKLEMFIEYQHISHGQLNRQFYEHNKGGFPSFMVIIIIVGMKSLTIILSTYWYWSTNL